MAGLARCPLAVWTRVARRTAYNVAELAVRATVAAVLETVGVRELALRAQKALLVLSPLHMRVRARRAQDTAGGTVDRGTVLALRASRTRLRVVRSRVLAVRATSTVLLANHFAASTLRAHQHLQTAVPGPVAVAAGQELVLVPEHAVAVRPAAVAMAVAEHNDVGAPVGLHHDLLHELVAVRDKLPASRHGDVAVLARRLAGTVLGVRVALVHGGVSVAVVLHVRNRRRA